MREHCLNPGTVLAGALALLVWCAHAPASSGLELPPIPEDGYFVQDYASLLDAPTLEQIEPIQRIAYQEHDTALVVVTIRSMADYGGEGWHINHFAREWFDQWEIGKTDRHGRLYNKGILLLVSRSDRLARIELGAEWGRRWDSHAARIMDQAIIPEYKVYDFNAGTLAGVDALAHMAELGPHGDPPTRVGSIWDNLDESPWALTPFSLGTVVLLFSCGVVLLILAWMAPKQRKILLIAGLGLITAAIVLWVLIGLAALFFMARDAGNAGDDGGFGGGLGAGGGFSAGGGGFGGGGFGGGGGATGGF